MKSDWKLQRRCLVGARSATPRLFRLQKLILARREIEPLGSGMHVSRSCTDLKAALAAPAAFGAALCPATPVPADVLAVKPRPAEPGVSASGLEGAGASLP